MQNDASGAGGPKDGYTVEQARVALETHVRTTRWLRRNLARKLNITSFSSAGAFHVVFESFTEKRAKSPTHAPYWDGPVDGPANGPEPDAWEIFVQIPGTFINRSVSSEVPHTATVKTCFTCNGRGDVTCHGCNGSGRNTCSRCGGDGRVQESRMVTKRDSQGNTTTSWESYTTTCSTCGGDGRVTCSTCGGSGRVTCPTCSGARRLKLFKLLTVTWTTHVTDHVLEKSDLPDELVSGAQGSVVHQEEQDIISALAEGAGGPFRGTIRVNQEVHRIANQLIGRHRFPAEEKLHRQRLTVRGVPVHEACYAWGKTSRRFWVFGLDEQVHAPEFPLSIIRISAVVVSCVAVVGLAGFLIQSWSASTVRPDTYARVQTPPPEPLPVISPPAPPPAPPPPPMLSASGAAPKPRPGKAVLELRTEPPGLDVLMNGKTLGKTPLFVSVASKEAGACKGGRGSGGACSGGRCSGGMCADKCIGAQCAGASCKGATCEGSSCPKGYRCYGEQCTGQLCTGASCEHDACVNQQCSSGACVGGYCAGGACRGGSCTGGACSGGICEPVTALTLRRAGEPDVNIEVAPSDGPIVEKRLSASEGR